MRLFNKQLDQTVLGVISTNALVFGLALWLDWNLYDLFLLFWLETVVFGVFGILELIKQNGWHAITTIPKYLLVFGAFMFGNFLFPTVMFIFALGPEIINNLSPVAVYQILLLKATVIALPLLCLLVNHTIQFVRTWNKANLNQEVFKATPYMTNAMYRLMAMYWAIFPMGFLLFLEAGHIYGFAVLLLFKTYAEASLIPQRMSKKYSTRTDSHKTQATQIDMDQKIKKAQALLQKLRRH